MKIIKLFTFILVAGLITSCGGGNKETGQITQKALIGRWQPEKIEIKDIPILLKKQIPKEDIERELLSEAQKKGYLELKGDGTFIIRDTSSEDEYVGKWSFDGDKKIEVEIGELKIASGTKDLKIGFYIVSVSKDKLEIDYASIYKAMIGMEKIPFFDMKMIMCYKRIK